MRQKVVIEVHLIGKALPAGVPVGEVYIIQEQAAVLGDEGPPLLVKAGISRAHDHAVRRRAAVGRHAAVALALGGIESHLIALHLQNRLIELLGRALTS